ncbi:hypothetical protein vBCbaSRXM_3 [Citromicrobium phage vB_CbaS-RXM]|nr:hypothetical protein vBCbaSRXM_3 [Citromicrobium phage vB_CbaS-RXM]
MLPDNFLEKYPRPDKSNRTAELAALILKQMTHIEPVDGLTVEQSADEVVFPVADTIPPHIAAHVAVLLVSRAERLHKLAEADCNYGLTEAQERTVEKLEGEVAEIAEAVGFRAECGGDPRGAVVKLYDPKDERAGDGFGGGFPVYR